MVCSTATSSRRTSSCSITVVSRSSISGSRAGSTTRQRSRRPQTTTARRARHASSRPSRVRSPWKSRRRWQQCNQRYPARARARSHRSRARPGCVWDAGVHGARGPLRRCVERRERRVQPRRSALRVRGGPSPLRCAEARGGRRHGARSRGHASRARRSTRTSDRADDGARPHAASTDSRGRGRSRTTFAAAPVERVAVRHARRISLAELVADPSDTWELGERIALIRNLRALGDTSQVVAQCKEVVRPPVFRYDFLLARQACEKR